MRCDDLFIARNYERVDLKNVGAGWVIGQELFAGTVYYLVISEPFITGDICSASVKVLNAFTDDCLPIDYLPGKNTVITEITPGEHDLHKIAASFWEYYETLRVHPRLSSCPVGG